LEIEEGEKTFLLKFYQGALNSLRNFALEIFLRSAPSTPPTRVVAGMDDYWKAATPPTRV